MRALTEPWSRPRDLSAAAGTILLRRPSMARSVARIAEAEAVRLSELFSPADLAALNGEGLLDAVLSTSPVTTVAIERVLTAIRRALLNDVDAIADADIWLPLASAIGRQGFLNEYVFNISDDESARVDALRDAVTASLQRGEAVAPIKLAVLAGYLPLHTLDGAEHWRCAIGRSRLRRW